MMREGRREKERCMMREARQTIKEGREETGGKKERKKDEIRGGRGEKVKRGGSMRGERGEERREREKVEEREEMGGIRQEWEEERQERREG